MDNTKTRRILGFPDEFWIGFLVLIGIFLKIVYDVTAGYSISTHNLGEWQAIVNDIPNGGHLGVIQYYMTYFKLPSFDPTLISGFTEPPLFYAFSALLLKYFYLVLGWELGTVLHCIQCLNAVFVMVGSFTSVSILTKFGVRGRKKVYALLFLMFFPGFYNLGAAMDNTPLAYMFVMLALNKVLRWYELRRKRDLIWSASFWALAMMTKLFAFVLIIPITALFLMATFYDRRASHGKMAQTAGIFYGIALIPGLFYPIRNFVKFGISPFLVEAERADWQNIGVYSAGQRLGLPRLAELTHLHLSKQNFYEYNIWGQTVKTAVVDERALNLTLSFTKGLAVILVFAVAVFALLSLVMLIRAFIGGRMMTEHKVFTGAALGGMLLCYVVKCLEYPYVSVMSFRQIPMLVIFFLSGYCLCGYAADSDNLFEKVTSRLGTVLIVTISVLSAFLFGFYAV